MHRTINYRRRQRKRKIERILNIAKNIWLRGLFEVDEKYIRIFAKTPKRCGKDCCKNPRKSKWNNDKDKLTNQELRDLDNTSNQLGEYNYL